jgi:predicted transcriptional regulator
MTTLRNDTTVHVTMLKSLKKKLDQLAKADRRDKTDFIRLLIEDEWNRRNAAEVAKGNGDRS